MSTGKHTLDELREEFGRARRDQTQALDALMRAITAVDGDFDELRGFLQSVLDGSTEYSIIAKDLDRRILSWNEGARRNYGYASDEVVGLSGDILHTDADNASGTVDALFADALEHGKSEGTFKRKRKDGSEFTASVVITRRDDARGTPIGYVVISRDITYEQRLREVEMSSALVQRRHDTLEEATRTHAELIAGLGHELRTPLGTITSLLEVMLGGRDGAPNPAHVPLLRDIVREGRRLEALVGNVLDFAAAEAGQLAFEPSPCSVSEVIDEVTQAVKDEPGDRRIDLVAEVASDMGQVTTDRRRLKQVVHNMVAAVAGVATADGRARLKASADGPDDFRVEVRAPSSILAGADVRALFEARGETIRRAGGVALGLAVARRIADAQHGEVALESDKDETALVATLPRRPTEGTRVPRRRKPRRVEGAPRVLVVEDDLADLERAVGIVSAVHLDVETARNVDEALKVLDEQPVDAVLLDLLLPDQHGFDVLHAIRSRSDTESLPVIVVTALRRRSLRIVHRVDAFLEKPLRRDDLLAALLEAGVRRSPAAVALVLSEDRATLRTLDLNLRVMGVDVVAVPTAAAGLAALERERFTAVIVDLLAQREQGLALLSGVRERRPDLPVIAWAIEAELTKEQRALLDAKGTQLVARPERGTSAVAEELQAKVLRCKNAAPTPEQS